MRSINEDHMIYGSRNIGHDRQNFLSFWAIFCPFTPPPPDDLENQNFEKLKKTSGVIINLHIRTINDNHMMYVF